jgi:hypothetical protein
LSAKPRPPRDVGMEFTNSSSVSMSMVRTGGDRDGIKQSV